MPASDSGLDADNLRPVVRAALDSPVAEVIEWSVEPILGGLDRASAVFRVSGTARVGAARPPWSVVLKTVRPRSGQADPTSLYYWRREARAYTSGVLDQLADGLVTARCLGVDEHEELLRLWLEDVDGEPGASWSPDRVQVAARRFGAFHGGYLAGRPLPTEDWIARSFRRQQSEEAAPGMERLTAMDGHPLVLAGWPDEVYEGVLRFWTEDRARFLDALEHLPQALQHGDVARSNLFSRPGPAGEEVVAIDWAFLQVGAVGEDLAVMWNQFARQAHATVDLFVAYVAGLRDAGWTGDDRFVLLGWKATHALRYLAHPLMLACLDEREHAHFERHRGMPVEKFLASLSSVVRGGLAQADQARDLLRLL
jgi:hypothetical protein